MDKNMKHKHYDLIIAWANGAEIQTSCSGVWASVERPHWRDEYEYRIKPAAKPCPERMEACLNVLLTRARTRQLFAIEFEGYILLALQPKEEI
jgi:hypothetical protein